MAVLRDMYGRAMKTDFPEISGLQFNSEYRAGASCSIDVLGKNGSNLSVIFSGLNNFFDLKSPWSNISLEKPGLIEETGTLMYKDSLYTSEEWEKTNSDIFKAIKDLKHSLEGILFLPQIDLDGEIISFNSEISSRKVKNTTSFSDSHFFRFVYEIQTQFGSCLADLDGVLVGMNDSTSYGFPLITFNRGTVWTSLNGITKSYNELTPDSLRGFNALRRDIDNSFIS